MAHGAMAVEAVAIVNNNSGSFLPTVLQGMQAEGGMGSGIAVAENAENAAFLVQLVIVEGIGRSQTHFGPRACGLEKLLPVGDHKGNHPPMARLIARFCKTVSESIAV
jgi:hypothetical protein